MQAAGGRLGRACNVIGCDSDPGVLATPPTRISHKAQLAQHQSRPARERSRVAASKHTHLLRYATSVGSPAARRATQRGACHADVPAPSCCSRCVAPRSSSSWCCRRASSASQPCRDGSGNSARLEQPRSSVLRASPRCTACRWRWRGHDSSSWPARLAAPGRQQALASAYGAVNAAGPSPCATAATAGGRTGVCCCSISADTAVAAMSRPARAQNRAGKGRASSAARAWLQQQRQQADSVWRRCWACNGAPDAVTAPGALLQRLHAPGHDAGTAAVHLGLAGGDTTAA